MYKVVIIEDENIIRKGLVYSIPWTELDCTVVGEGCNGMEGVSLIEEKKPDIVVLDINMPVMDGLEMLERTYEHHNYSAIILSGYSDFEYAQKAIHYGVKGYLLKPLQVEELIDAIILAKKECDLRKIWQSKQQEKDELRNISIIKHFHDDDIENELVKKMLNYMNANYNKKIVMQDLVDHFNYSETFLNKVFKEAIGTTIIDYLNRYRVQKALELMRSGETSIQNVADNCGIGDYKYFNVVFRKYMGISPKEYLKAVMVIAYMIKYMLMGMRTVVSAFSQISPSLEEAAQISGSGWLRRLKDVVLPLIVPSVVAGWFLIFMPCFYELTMSNLLYSNNTKTLGVELFTYQTYHSQQTASALASGILIMVIVLNYVLNKVTKGKFSI